MTLYYGIGMGCQSKRGFTHFKANRVEFIRPPFSSAVQQFIRKTSATYYTPWPFGSEGATGGTVTAGITEAASATDSPSAIYTGVCAILEAITALDAPTAVNIATAALTEAATATSIEAATSIVIAAVTEIANAVDTPDFIATTIHEVSITESASAEDGQVGVILTSAGISEILSAIESQSATVAYQAAALEEATAAESQNAAFVVVKLALAGGLVHRVPPVSNDLRMKIVETTIGIPVVTASDNAAGAIRINVSGTVYALQRAI